MPKARGLYGFNYHLPGHVPCTIKLDASVSPFRNLSEMFNLQRRLKVVLIRFCWNYDIIFLHVNLVLLCHLKVVKYLTERLML